MPRRNRNIHQKNSAIWRRTLKKLRTDLVVKSEEKTVEKSTKATKENRE